ncbi:MAG TPA: RNA methyltransferase [Candidatus Limnocylindria bacterium]|nr:RNA methyltransferase [Candidatus Limnocylindria bacterium]
MQIKHVTAFDRPELVPYATLRQNEEHKAAGIFVAEGAMIVQRLLESQFGVVSVLLPEKRLAEFEPLIRARAEDVTVYVMELAELEKLVGFPFFQGVLAVGKIRQTHTLDSILANAPRPHFLVAFDALANADNIGLMVRSAAAFGAQAIIVGETSASPFLRRAVRNSIGAIFKLPVVQTIDLIATLRDLRSRGVRIIAAHPQTDGRTIHDVDFKSDCCVLFGSESTGISEEVLAACDEAVAIPMSNEVDSLNVGTAAAVFLYEVARQRRIS